MASFNKVILMGNLTRDPETRVTPNNLTICKLGLAVNRVYTTQDGERKEETTFVDVDCFGRTAETISRYMSKGRPILIEGRLRLDQWETNGEKRSKLMVVCENFQFVGGREDGDGQGGGYEGTSPPPRQSRARPAASQDQAASQADSSAGEDFDDDVPF